jgi:hypothetical protein
MKTIYQRKEKYLEKKYIQLPLKPHPQPLSLEERGAKEVGSFCNQR